MTSIGRLWMAAVQVRGARGPVQQLPLDDGGDFSNKESQAVAGAKAAKTKRDFACRSREEM